MTKPISYKIVKEQGRVFHRGNDILKYGTPLVGGSGWTSPEFNEVPYAVAAFNGSKQPIGILKFDVHGRKKRLVFSFGTWVSKNHRRKGIAKGMWKRALRFAQADVVKVTVVSDAGYTLSEALQETHPRTRFEVCEDGNRCLRDMRR